MKFSVWIVLSVIAITQPAFGEIVNDPRFPNDAPVNLNPVSQNPNALNGISDSTGRSAMEGETFNAATTATATQGAADPLAAQTGVSSGGIRDVNSFDQASLNLNAPIPEETMAFILKLDECIKSFGVRICKLAIANILEGNPTPEQNKSGNGGQSQQMAALLAQMAGGAGGQAGAGINPQALSMLAQSGNNQQQAAGGANPQMMNVLSQMANGNTQQIQSLIPQLLGNLNQ